MQVPFLYAVVLICLQKIQGERTIYSIYHLLNGKKSAQTIQDAHLFHLQPFFKTYPSLTRVQFEEIVNELRKEKFVTEAFSSNFVLTDKGYNLIKDITAYHKIIFSNLNGWRFQQTDVFWQRLTLLIQVISYMVRNENQYIPIQREKAVQQTIKRVLRALPMKRLEIGTVLFDEIVRCLERNEGMDPAIVVLRFTGCSSIGLTEVQACQVLKLEPTLYHYQFYSFLHFLMDEIQKQPHEYPILSLIVEGMNSDVPLTESTKKTYGLLLKGFSIEKIGQIRRLKINTIQDHIVELALQIPGFDISPYVETDKVKRILAAKEQSTSKQLRFIREMLPDVNYFEIRLVLAKFEDR